MKNPVGIYCNRQQGVIKDGYMVMRGSSYINGETASHSVGVHVRGRCSPNETNRWVMQSGIISIAGFRIARNF
jgi:hypothetical protein